jgi:hypothetical protein
MPIVRSWIVAGALLAVVVGGCGTAAAVTAAQSAAGSIQLTAEAVAVMLTPSAAAQRLDTANQIWLVLLDVQAAAQPGVQYGLYLNLPAGVPAIPSSPHYVGALNFFSAVGTPRVYSFDATGVVKALHAQDRLRDGLVVTIRPAGPPADDAKPVIGRVELIAE